MAELKVVINDPKTGKSYQKALTENIFNNKKVGDSIKGEELDLSGYELKITGGSDKSGCPIRYDMPGFGKKKALLSSGPCVHINVKGLRKKKLKLHRLTKFYFFNQIIINSSSIITLVIGSEKFD